MKNRNEAAAGAEKAPKKNLRPVTVQPERPAKREGSQELHSLNRASGAVHRALMKVLSNLRLSLTLRIAFYAAGQLLCTTLLALAVVLGAFCAARLLP